MSQQVSYRHFKSGIASFVSNYIAGIFHPFDVIKTRFQSHDGKSRNINLVPEYRGMLHAFKQIITYQGIQGIFKGIHISLLSNAIASSIFFWIYQSRKQSYLKKDLQSMIAVSLASFESGVLASIISQPFWVIKTRMLLNITPKTGQFRNFIDKTKQIYQQYGLKGYTKGLSLNIWLSLTAISQMVFYQGTKLIYDSIKIPQTKYLQKNFICGGISKVLSALLMYPLTTVRTRIQQNQYVYSHEKEKYRGIGEIIKMTMKLQGIRGFYKGLTPNMIKGIPQKGVYFYFYELIKQKIFDIEPLKKE